MEAKFMMMCGVSGSGKSTFAKEIAEGRDDILYLSSDELREELLGDVNEQSGNTEVFEEMKRRTVKGLKSGVNVIYDATNLSRKRRRGLIKQLPKDVHKTIVYMVTPISTSIGQNNNRKRVVPEDVIMRQYKSFQIPLYTEGWDNIVFQYHNDILNYDLLKQLSDSFRLSALLGRDDFELIRQLALYFNEFLKAYDMPLDSKHNRLSLGRHLYQTYKCLYYSLQATHDPIGDDEMEVYLWMGLLHDIGKPYCKEFDEREFFATYNSHENISAQMAICILKRLGFSDFAIHKISVGIEMHHQLDEVENGRKTKLEREIGSSLYDKIALLKKANNFAK